MLSNSLKKIGWTVAIYSALAGCALVDRKAYEGAERGAGEVAKVRPYGKGVIVEGIDSHRYVPPFFSDDKRHLTAFFEVLPGEHTIKLRYKAAGPGNLPGVVDSYMFADGEAKFIAEAGHTYVPKAVVEGKNVVFTITDMGANYESKCNISRGGKGGFISNDNDKAFSGEGIFAEGGACQ